MKNHPIIEIAKLLGGVCGAVYFLIKAAHTQDNTVVFPLLAYIVCGVIAYVSFRKLKGGA